VRRAHRLGDLWTMSSSELLTGNPREARRSFSSKPACTFVSCCSKPHDQDQHAGYPPWEYMPGSSLRGRKVQIQVSRAVELEGRGMSGLHRNQEAVLRPRTLLNVSELPEWLQRDLG